MNLKKAIDCLRRTNTRSDLIYLVLALMEIGATDTPFFAGLEGNELLASLLAVLSIREADWQENLDDYEPDDFLGFLANNEHQLKFNVTDLQRLMVEIKQQGEEHYEFRKFVKVVDGNG